MKHIYLAKPHCRGAAEISEWAPNVLLCLHGAEDMKYELDLESNAAMLMENPVHSNTQNRILE